MESDSGSGKTTIEWESRVGFPRLLVAGVDEVGRGCLAGPVVAAALLLPPIVDYAECPWLAEVTDSKLLDAETRERLSPLIQGWARSWSIGSASVEEIDRLNIYHASHLAMIRALDGLQESPAHILIDGNRVPRGLRAPATPVVKGDLACLSIAGASIVAKVYRDRLMAQMDAEYPGYGFSSHKGYSTPAHLKSLKALGACKIHRSSFAPVAEKLAETSPETAASSQGKLFE